jgi:plasmid stabilization system protein ParE
VTRRVRFEPEAVSELREAALWYEDRRKGLGLAFLAAVEDAIEVIVRWPNSGALVSGVSNDLVLRQARVRRFPHHVGYLLTNEDIRVLAIAHNRRRPGYWFSHGSL